MQSLWRDEDAKTFGDDLLQLRVYTSRLLGQDPSLVLHGGGNTSVKANVTNLFDETELILYVKGSGWDLATIEAPGFSPVKMEALLKLAEMPNLTDTDIVREQRSALIDPYAPNPSVEAILHAIIPHTFVDHTHSDAVVTLTNTPSGRQLIEEVYGDRIMIIPYVMPGFTLARKVYEMTLGLDWSTIDGMILLNHGVFTFNDDPRAAYESMIEIVSKAEDYLEQHGASKQIAVGSGRPDFLTLSKLRKVVSDAADRAMLARLTDTPEAVGFANLPGIEQVATRGPLTPDHVIRTKRIPLVMQGDPQSIMEKYAEDYRAYFDRNTDGSLTILDPAPRWAVWAEVGTVAFGENLKAANIVSNINRHTVRAIQWAETIEAWQALPEKDIFDVEYWELEQAKLKKGGASLPFSGKIAIVTGAASGIGLACAEMLQDQGSVVVGLDINPDITRLFLDAPGYQGIVCDITDEKALQSALDETVKRFGGIDMLVSNAGIFPPSTRIEEMDSAIWDRSIALNLSSHQRLLTMALPYLKNGIDPAIVFVGSKNVPAPGPGQAAYSAAKAGLAQFARIAALELGEYGIRVNTVHPNAVFDTGLWTEETLTQRAKHYEISIEEYKSNNILGVEIRSRDVAELVCVMLGSAFKATTGGQIPIDGGNDRVI